MQHDPSILPADIRQTPDSPTSTPPDHSNEELKAEADRRIGLLRYATREEITACVNNTTGLTHDYFVAFGSNPQPRIPKEQVEQIIEEHGSYGSSNKRISMNKGRVLQDRGLIINAEKIPCTDAVIAWVLQSTRVQIIWIPTTEIPPGIQARHDKARALLPELEEGMASLLEFFINQHIGLPLDQLSKLSGQQEEKTLEIINALNRNHLVKTGMKIAVRNGIAILAEHRDSVSGSTTKIAIINTAETRKRLFPQGKTVDPATEDAQPTTTSGTITPSEAKAIVPHETTNPSGTIHHTPPAPTPAPDPSQTLTTPAPCITPDPSETHLSPTAENTTILNLQSQIAQLKTRAEAAEAEVAELTRKLAKVEPPTTKTQANPTFSTSRPGPTSSTLQPAGQPADAPSLPRSPAPEPAPSPSLSPTPIQAPPRTLSQSSSPSPAPSLIAAPLPQLPDSPEQRKTRVEILDFVTANSINYGGRNNLSYKIIRLIAENFARTGRGTTHKELEAVLGKISKHRMVGQGVRSQLRNTKYRLQLAIVDTPNGPGYILEWETTPPPPEKAKIPPTSTPTTIPVSSHPTRPPVPKPASVPTPPPSIPRSPATGTPIPSSTPVSSNLSSPTPKPAPAIPVFTKQPGQSSESGSTGTAPAPVTGILIKKIIIPGLKPLYRNPDRPFFRYTGDNEDSFRPHSHCFELTKRLAQTADHSDDPVSTETLSTTTGIPREKIAQTVTKARSILNGMGLSIEIFTPQGEQTFYRLSWKASEIPRSTPIEQLPTSKSTTQPKTASGKSITASQTLTPGPIQPPSSQSVTASKIPTPKPTLTPPSPSIPPKPPKPKPYNPEGHLPCLWDKQLPTTNMLNPAIIEAIMGLLTNEGDLLSSDARILKENLDQVKTSNQAATRLNHYIKILGTAISRALNGKINSKHLLTLLEGVK